MLNFKVTPDYYNLDGHEYIATFEDVNIQIKFSTNDFGVLPIPNIYNNYEKDINNISFSGRIGDAITAIINKDANCCIYYMDDPDSIVPAIGRYENKQEENLLRDFIKNFNITIGYSIRYKYKNSEKYQPAICDDPINSNMIFDSEREANEYIDNCKLAISNLRNTVAIDIIQKSFSNDSFEFALIDNIQKIENGYQPNYIIDVIQVIKDSVPKQYYANKFIGQAEYLNKYIIKFRNNKDDMIIKTDDDINDNTICRILDIIKFYKLDINNISYVELFCIDNKHKAYDLTPIFQKRYMYFKLNRSIKNKYYIEAIKSYENNLKKGDIIKVDDLKTKYHATLTVVEITFDSIYFTLSKEKFN